jgi:hypothetical protein
MPRRSLVSVGWVMGLCLAVAAAPGVAAGQGTGAAGSYAAPRTPDGQPDLQGFWSNQTYTRLERPDGVTSEYYTPEQLAAIVSGAATQESAQTDPGTIPDVHYDFTQFGLDRSQAARADNFRTSLIVDPPDGRLPPVNAEGQRRAAERAAAQERLGGRWDSAESNQLDDRCIMMAAAGPPMMNTGYNSNFQIVQSPDSVMILAEMIHDARVVPLDGPARARPAEGFAQWVGLSRGWWEGETLVVETSNFNAKNPFRGSSEKMTVTERFTRVGEDRIDYQFTIDDPGTWDRPWAAELPMQRSRGPLFEFACHEGNYGLYNTLVGARMEEAEQRAGEAAEPGGDR